MIELKNLTKTYNKGKTNSFEALHGISMKIEDGELVAITGKSGAGKSTILHILAGIDTYEDGEYIVDGILVKGMSDKKLANFRNRQIGIVMQDYALVDDFTVIENVMLPLDFAKNRLPKKIRHEKAMAALAAVDMDSIAKKPVFKLSGGQKQRVAIARALINEPSIILADEPTGALDSANADAIMQLFQRFHEEGKTVIIVTHDRELAEGCDRQIEIVDGSVRK